MFDRCEAARHVFIGIPCYNGQLKFDTFFAAMSAVVALKAVGIEVSVKGVEGNCYIDNVRNQLVAHFRTSDATDLLFWDDDVGCLPQTVVKICRSTRPLVCAVYPKKSDDEEWPVDFIKGTHSLDEEGLIEAKMVPTGMLRINRRVFNVMEQELQLEQYDTRDAGTVTAFFETDIRNRAYWGEDVEFCRLWREMGGKIRVLPDEDMSHTGMKTWIGKVGNALRAGKF